VFGWVAGQGYVSPTEPSLRTYQGDYAVLDIQDGNLSFSKAGGVKLDATHGNISGALPSVPSFGGIEQTMAYQRTQSFLQNASLVNEVSGLLWWNTYRALGVLYANLPNGEKFLNPKLTTQWFQPTIYSRYSEYGQVFVPFSLSSKMAMLWAGRVFSTSYSQQDGIYVLGLTTRVKRVDPSLPFISRVGGYRGVTVDVNQKTLLEGVP